MAGGSLNLVGSLRWPSLVLSVVAAACGSSDDGSKFVANQSEGGSADVQAFCPLCSTDSDGVGDGHSVHSDFPSTPVLDTPDGGVAAPSNAMQLFGSPSQGAQSGGPCLIEPEVGSLYPKNWLRPRFRWVAGGGENLFELRLHVANQT